MLGLRSVRGRDQAVVQLVLQKCRDPPNLLDFLTSSKEQPDRELRIDKRRSGEIRLQSLLNIKTSLYSYKVNRAGRFGGSKFADPARREEPIAHG